MRMIYIPCFLSCVVGAAACCLVAAVVRSVVVILHMCCFNLIVNLPRRDQFRASSCRRLRTATLQCGRGRLGKRGAMAVLAASTIRKSGKGMAVILNTSLGNIVIDLHTELCPFTTKNFLKLCKLKYYNNCLFHDVKRDFIAQTGDPTGEGSGGDSVYKFLYGDQARFFNDELRHELTHSKIGTVAMASAGHNLNASQFYITLRAGLDYLDGKHTVFGEVAGGLETLMRINETYVNGKGRPYKNIRIKHVDILEDPFEDPPQLEDLIPDRSPEVKSPTEVDEVRLEDDWVPLGEEMEPEELDKSMCQKEAHCRAAVLEMMGGIPECEVAPPENEVFVCELNSMIEHQREGDAATRDANDGDITMPLQSGGVEEPSNNGELHGCTNRDKEEWSPAEAISLLEAYEERLGDGRTGNLKAKEWEEVAAAVNRRFDGKGLGLASKSLKQCKRKVYALRRWFKTAMSKQMTFREGGYDHTLLCILERIMTQSTPCQAGIPGGIDAGERKWMPLTTSLFDEEEADEELIQASRAVIPPELDGAFAGMVSSMQSRIRGIIPDGRRRREGPTNTTGTTDSNCGDENGSCKKPCLRSCRAITHSDEVVSALNSFAKVLAQVEQTKIDIMKDLDKRRAELQLKLAKVEPVQQDSDESPPSAILTLL